MRVSRSYTNTCRVHPMTAILMITRPDFTLSLRRAEHRLHFGARLVLPAATHVCLCLSYPPCVHKVLLLGTVVQPTCHMYPPASQSRVSHQATLAAGSCNTSQQRSGKGVPATSHSSTSYPDVQFRLLQPLIVSSFRCALAPHGHYTRYQDGNVPTSQANILVSYHTVRMADKVVHLTWRCCVFLKANMRVVYSSDA